MSKEITAAIYYNKWTGWENNKVASFFRQGTEEDLKTLKPGDKIWLDTDPIHPNGKVYGYLASIFKKFEDGKLEHSDGWTTMLGKLYILTDKEGFESYVKEHPLATKISVFDDDAFFV